jgi:hypothetical protein
MRAGQPVKTLGRTLAALVFWLGAVMWLGATPMPARAATWLETSLAGSSDNNIYSYVLPYSDSLSLVELKLNHKNKLTRTTHYLANYFFRDAAYNRWSSKNYLNNSLNLGLEEDLIADLVAGISAQGTYYAYPDNASSKYNYLNWVAAANLRWYTFFMDFTSWEAGVKYQAYTLPNYNFMQEGWTPSLTFMEEVAEYNGTGAYVNIKQGLPWSLDLELGGTWINNVCPERPLYAGAHDRDFTSELRRDQELNLNAALSWRFLKNSNVRLGYGWGSVASNANALVYDAAAGVVELEAGYYDRMNQCVNLGGLYCYGKENSYVRVNTSLTSRTYSGRRAQDAQGRISSANRSDREYNVLVELNQRLGEWLGTQWMLRLGYNYIQSQSNDYYYSYIREVYTLGFVSNFYWE